MSDKTELELDGGFKLTHMVQAQRGLSDLEIEIFLATGQKPDLSQPPLEYADETPDDAQIMSEEDAEAWLSGAPLTASSFYDFNSSHGVSPLYEEVVRPKVRAFDWDPHQPRDHDGRWTDGFPGKGAVGILEKAAKKTVASTKKATPAVIYKKHDDGAVVGHTNDGKRMRWDAGRKKFVVEKQNGEKWTEESALSKTNAYNDMKNPDKWFEPTETGTENGPSETSQKPEPDLADTEPTVPNEPEMVDGDTPVKDDTPDLPPGWKAVPDGSYYKGIPGNPYGGSEVKQLKDGTWRHDFFDGKKSKSSTHDTLDEALAHDPQAEEKKAPEAPKPMPAPEPEATPNAPQDLGGKYPPPEPVPMVDPDWPFSYEPFQEPQMDYGHLVRSNDDAYKNDPNHDYELKTLPVKQIVPSQENDYEEWGDGLDNDMTGKPFAIKKDGNYYLMDGHHRTAKKGENGSVEAWVLDLDKPKEKKAEAAPEIPQQAEAPAVEMDEPGVYTGPTAENYGGAPKGVTDKVRAAQVAAIAHEHRVEALADELRKDKSKYDGYDGWTKSRKDAEAQLASEAPPDSELDGALDELRAALPDYTTYDQVYRRLGLEAGVEVRMAKFTEKNGLGALTPEVKADLTKRMKESFTGKKVAVRVSPKTVEHILNDGRIKSQFETNKSSGKKDFGVRASIERALFGITDKPHQNAEKRPIYGYVAMDGIRPAGVGSSQLGDPSTDALSQYGQVQVVLKDHVRDRTTAMFGDSMNNMSEAIPTPINNPDWRSFQASRGGITGKGLMGLDRSGDNQEFRAGAYAEAQIHGGVGVDDIEEIVFPNNPTATVKDQLEKAGIPYRVMNFKTAADGSDEERATALRIAEEDKPFIEGEIAKIKGKIDEFKAKGNNYDVTYYEKDLAKYEKQLKAINDALPALRGEKKSTKSKVAAAKEKVAKATAPKQAEPPKIESTGTKLSAAEEQELTALQNQISELYGQSGYWRMREAEITHKGNGGILTPEDLKDSQQAYNELKKLRDAATPLAERELELRMKRDGDVFGEVDDVNAERWAKKAKPSSVMLPGNDPAKIEKIADSYRVNDKATTEHNMSLRSDEPTQAAVSWRSRMKRMVNSQQLTQDSVVYRGAALTPDRIMQLRPGAVMIDPGSMSTDESRGSAEFYMKTRLDDLPGTLGTVFEIRAPKGMPAADVEYGEFVFDFHTPMRIVSTKRENGIVNVVAELVPPDEAKSLYGAPPVPKAAKPSGVDLNKGKRGSIKAKDARNIHEKNFLGKGIQPSSPPQEIFDQAKKTAYYNDYSVMQVLEAIDAMKPGYKKTVLNWLKTPEGIEYASKKSTS